MPNLEKEPRWPNPLQSLLWDLLPGAVAPKQDGVIPPKLPSSPSLPDKLSIDDLQVILDHARRAHDRAVDAVVVAEEKGNRTLNRSLALLATCFPLLKIASGAVMSGTLYWTIVSSILAAIGSLALAALTAMNVDRVGIFFRPRVQELAAFDPEGGDPELLRRLIVAEDRGEFLASWSSVKKISSVMDARAWVSRGLFFLLIGSTASGLAWLFA